MRAHLLLVKLPYTVEGLRPQVEALVAALPQGTRRVIALDQVIGFLMPHGDVAEVQAARWTKVMAAFSDYWIIGLNGELACKNKSADPFRTWMNEFLRVGSPVNRDEAKDVPFPETWKPRAEPSVHDLIERTFGKVGLKPSPDKERP